MLRKCLCLHYGCTGFKFQYQALLLNSQVQVPTLIHENTPHCAIIISCQLTKNFNWCIAIHFNTKSKTPITELVLI